MHLCTVIIANTLLEPSWIVRIKKEKSPWPVPSQNLSITPGHFPFDILHVRLIWSFWYRRTAVYPNSYCPVIGLPIKRIDVTQTALLQLVLKVFLADKTMSHDWNPQVQSVHLCRSVGFPGSVLILGQGHVQVLYVYVLSHLSYEMIICWPLVRLSLIL